MTGYVEVAQRVAQAARRADRSPDEIRIVGAAKAQSVETVVGQESPTYKIEWNEAPVTT